MSKAKRWMLNQRRWHSDGKDHWKGSLTLDLGNGLSVRVGTNMHSNKRWDRKRLKDAIDGAAKKYGIV